MLWQRTPIARPQLLQPGASIAIEWFVCDPLGEQQAVNPVHMRDTLGRQGFALARDSTTILLFWRRHADHRADPWFTAFVRHQGAKQCFSINAVGLGPTASTRRHN